MVQPKILITEFFNQFNNGEDFTLNPADVTPNLVGNVTEKMKTRQQVAISWISNSNVVTPFVITAAAPNTLTKTGGQFFNDGFVQGDFIDLYDLSGGVIFSNRKITSMTPDTIEFDGGAIAPTSLANGRMYGVTPLTSLRFKFGLIENSESVNFVSKIDGTAENVFTSANITAGFTPMVSASGVNSWKEAKDLANNSVNIKSLGSLPQAQDFAQIFEITHEFSVLPYFEDGQLSNIQNLLAPFLFSSTNTLKYVYSTEFGTSLSNPTGNKTAVFDNIQGSVGYLNESLNGNTLNYSVISLTYTNQDTLTAETAINAQQKTRVNFNLRNTNSSFNASTKVVVGISLLPPLSSYQQNQNDIDKNFLLDRAFTTVDLAFVDSSIITKYTSILNNADSISVEFDVDYLTIDEPTLQNKNYVIWVTTADSSLSAIDTDRATLKVDSQVYLFNTDIDDLIFVDRMFHFPHDVDDTEDDEAFDNYVGWLADGFTVKIPFEINNDKVPLIDTLKIHFSARNPSTDDRFDLQTYNYNLSGAVSVPTPGFNNSQEINIDQERSFKLADGSQFNKATLTTLSGFASRGPINVKQYVLTTGIKANFEEWIAQPGANTIFYDANEPNNGLNKKTPRYSLQEGYEIVVTLEVVLSTLFFPSGFFNPVITLTTYEFFSQPHRYFDFDLDENVTPAYSVDIVIFDEDGANTDSVLITGENSIIIATFTPDSGSTAFVDPYAIMRIYPVGGNINTILELSSFRPSIVDNILIPLDGEDFTKITDDGNTVVVECRVDGNLLDEGTNYNVIAELRDSSTLVGILTEDGNLLTTETGDIIIIG